MIQYDSICMYVRTRLVCMYVCMYVCLCVCVSVCPCVRVSVCLCVCMSVYIYICNTHVMVYTAASMNYLQYEKKHNTDECISNVCVCVCVLGCISNIYMYTHPREGKIVSQWNRINLLHLGYEPVQLP